MFSRLEEDGLLDSLVELETKIKLAQDRYPELNVIDVVFNDFGQWQVIGSTNDDGMSIIVLAEDDEILQGT